MLQSCQLLLRVSWYLGAFLKPQLLRSCDYVRISDLSVSHTKDISSPQNCKGNLAHMNPKASKKPEVTYQEPIINFKNIILCFLTQSHYFGWGWLMVFECLALARLLFSIIWYSWLGNTHTRFLDSYFTSITTNVRWSLLLWIKIWPPKIESFQDELHQTIFNLDNTYPKICTLHTLKSNNIYKIKGHNMEISKKANVHWLTFLHRNSVCLIYKFQ